VDQKTGILYWGDVGPDAGEFDAKRGPAGFDAVMQAKQPGFFGWPYSRGDNRPYARIDFVVRDQYLKAKADYDAQKKASDAAAKEAKASGKPAPAFALRPPVSFSAANTAVMFDPAKPVNKSPNNTGIKELPPTQPAFIWYPNAPSTRFPAVNGGGGRTAMAGPVYYYDEKNPSKAKLPKEYDHTLFIYEWSRNWIVAVHLDENNNIARNPDGTARMKRFCQAMTFKRPMDMELGADGCLYLIEFGTAWGNNKDTQIVRLEHNGPKD
jgi:cytochrome c